MKFTNLLRIFTDEEIDLLKSGNIDNLKKKFLLEFQLSDKTTAVFNNHEVDKNEVLYIFSEIKLNLNKYLIFTLTPEIKAFFESNDFAIFTDQKIRQTIDYSGYKNELLTSISTHLNTLLPDLILNNKLSINALNEIISFYSGHDSYLDVAFNNTYKSFDTWLRTLEDVFENPFLPNTYIVYKKEVHDNVKLSLRNQFDALPQSFSALKSRYVSLVNSKIINQSVLRASNLNQYTKSSLITLRESFKIGMNESNQESYLSSISSINRSLREETYNSSSRSENQSAQKSSGLRTAFSILILIITIFKFSALLSTCNTSSNYNSNNHRLPEYTMPSQTPYQQNIEQARSRSIKTTRPPEWNQTAASIKTKSDFVELVFNVDEFPSNFNGIETIIPENIIKKYKNKFQLVKIIFKLNNFTGVETSHFINLNFDVGPYTEYVEIPNKPNDIASVTIKKLNSQDATFIGKVSTFNKDKNIPISSYSFTLKTTKNKIKYNYKIKGQKEAEFLISQNDDILQVTNNNELEKRLKALIYNVSNISGSKLSRDYTYSLNKQVVFDFKKAPKPEKSDYKAFRYVSSNIKYYSSSKADNLLYCSTIGSESSTKYQIQNKTGEIFGVQFIITNLENYTYEKIELYRK